MSENIEGEIRKALDEQAYTVDVPEDLASQTLAKAAAIDVHTPLWGRFQGWRDARQMRLPAGGYPRWLLAPAAVATVVALFAIGTVVTMQPGNRAPEAMKLRSSESTSSTSGDASAGQVGGVASSGDASVGGNTSEDVDISPGSAGSSNSSSSFGGLTAGSAARPASGSVATAQDDPQLVRSAHITVAVDDFERGWNGANDIAAEHDGKVFDIQTSQATGTEASGTLMIRVPSDELDGALTDLRRLGVMTSLRTNGSDISSSIELLEREIHDLNVKAKQGGTMSELESIRKKKRNLERQLAGNREQVETSIIRATIIQDEILAETGGSLIDKSRERLGNAVTTAGKVSLTILAGALVLAGALLPLALIGAAIWFIRRRVMARRA